MLYQSCLSMGFGGKKGSWVIRIYYMRMGIILYIPFIFTPIPWYTGLLSMPPVT